MAVCRVIKEDNYTVLDNYHLDDKRLSLKARGLLSTMLRLPNDWSYTIEGLTKLCRDGKASVRSAIEELEKYHYIRRQQLRGGSGTFGDNEYLIYERPYDAPLCENRTTVGPPDKAPLCGFPSTGNPPTENPLSENRTQLNTKIPSTKKPIPPKAPQGGRRAAKKAPDHEPEMFARFWKAYPRKEDKQGAIAEWDRLKPDMELMREMSAALERQKSTEDWQRRIGIPYAVRWLRRRRWEDEVYIPPKATASPAPTRVVDMQEVDEW